MEKNTRDLRMQGQDGFIAKRKQQRRPRLQADAFLFRPSVPRFDQFGQCARVKFLRICYLVIVSTLVGVRRFPALHLLFWQWVMQSVRLLR
jgi:hypothetical protein